MSIELHRPYVDDITIKCPECGKSMHRIPEVMDCWFDSGAMPFAQWHYPFEKKDNFDGELFPADFICEGIDQTRGWFYSLMAISTIVKGCAPYKNVLVNDLILDKNGKKMWQWSDGMAFTQALCTTTIAPHSFEVYKAELDSKEYRKIKDDAVLVTAYVLDTPCKLSAKLPTIIASNSTPVLIHGGVIFGSR